MDRRTRDRRSGGPREGIDQRPPPLPPIQDPAPDPARSAAERTEPTPVWSIADGGPKSPGVEEAVGPPAKKRSLRRGLGRSAVGLTSVLLVFFLLSLANVCLAWMDAEIRPPGLKRAVLGYGACCALVVFALMLRGRWRSVPVLLASALGVMLPVYLVTDLLTMLGVREVWIGQSLTVAVLFPLVLGGVAVVANLCNHRVRTEPSRQQGGARTGDVDSTDVDPGGTG